MLPAAEILRCRAEVCLPCRLRVDATPRAAIKDGASRTVRHYLHYSVRYYAYATP